MNWQHNFNNPTGFVYFTVNPIMPFPNPIIPFPNPEAGDFLAFNTPPMYGSPECNRFTPNHFSSPNKFQNSPRNFHGKQGRNSFRYHNSRDNSFNSPSTSFNGNTRNSRGYQSKNNSFNNSFNNSGKKDISCYLDHTCTKDPWAELEQKLKETQKAEASQNNVPDQSSSSSADEQESDIETKASSSEAEEGTT